MHQVVEGGVGPSDARHAYRMLFAHYTVSASLLFPRQVAIAQLVALQTLVPTDVRPLQDREQETRHSAKMDFTRREACGGANVNIVVELDVGQMHISLVSSFVDHHGEHLRHSMDGTFGATGGHSSR